MYYNEEIAFFINFDKPVHIFFARFARSPYLETGLFHAAKCLIYLHVLAIRSQNIMLFDSEVPEHV